MKSWTAPPVPTVAGRGAPLRLRDTGSGRNQALNPTDTVRMYVCGITPYDATHLGHAATYVAFDLVNRVLRDNGHDVHYTQNVTDVDDPLLERAARDGISWRDLAATEANVFREDMTALRVIPPTDYIGVVEAIPQIADLVRRTMKAGAAYPLSDAQGQAAEADIYLDLARAESFGSISGWSRAEMMAVFAERGGDPDRPGKRDPLDPLLWRAARPGEPSWAAAGVPDGRPGWHVECTAIAQAWTGLPLHLNGGGSDLIFPHHEMTAASASVLGIQRYAGMHAHSGMVGFEGHKMSKSRGNLVLVSALRAHGVDPMAIRLCLLEHHYREDWDFFPPMMARAQERMARWRAALSRATGADPNQAITAVRSALSNDLDAPAALRAVDEWVERAGDERGAPAKMATALDALLGVRA